VEWVDFLRTVKRWGPDDPLFPTTKVGQGEALRFEVLGIGQGHWRNAEPIRKVFREAFESSGIPYANPHSFRKTLARLGQQRCRTPEEFKAWSQNLGHDQVATTLTSYGEVPRERQALIMRSLAQPNAEREDLGEVQKILEAVTTLALSRRRIG
jgi:integrase